MILFYKGIIKGSYSTTECLISAKDSLEAENKLLSYYDAISRKIGEIKHIGIFNIEASEYYGALKYQHGIFI